MRVALRDPRVMDEAFRAQWRALEARAADPANPYYCAWFLEPALARIAPQSIRLLTVMDDAGGLVALAPVERGETLAKLPLRHFATWRHSHAYNSAPLCAKGAADAAYRAIFDWIDTHPEGARFIRLNEHPCPGDHAGLAAASGRDIAVNLDMKRAILTRACDFETAYASGYSGKKRKELRRQWRRLEEDGALKFERWTSPGDIARAADAYVSLELAGWKGRAEDVSPVGASAAETSFFREAMTRGAEAGAVICDAATVDARPIAMLFSLRCGGTLCAYKISYDEAFAAHSPGVHLLVEAMRLMLADPSIALFDSCARAGHPVVDHLWRERMRVAQYDVCASPRLDRAMFGAALRIAAVRRSLTAPKRRQAETMGASDDGGATD